MGKAIVDWTGKRSGKLVGLRRVGSKSGHFMWLCRCDCGNEVVVRSDKFGNGHTQSCGCLWHEITSHRVGNKGPNFKHGGVGTVTYRCYLNMIYRCTDANSGSFPHYGGAVPYVTFLDAWHPENEGYVAFLRDMGERPEGTTLGRRLDTGPYAPWNAEWQTKVEQQAEATGKIAMIAWHQRRAVDRGTLRRWRKKFVSNGTP